LAVLIVGYIPIENLRSVAFAKWAIAQLSFFQFYNPDFMRGFGIGVLNGSLWTICVELQFYVLMPLLAWLIRFKMIYILVVLASFGINVFLNSDFAFTGMLGKFLGVSFLPWVAMFMLGHFAFDQWHNIKKWFSGKFLVWFAVYLVAATIAYFAQYSSGVFISGNQLLFPLQILLGAVVLSMAFTQNGFSQAFLHHNDISYGIYIYHMPIINLLLFSGLSLSGFTFILTLAITAFMASLSWLLVEQPILRSKLSSRKKLTSQSI
jgi:peptidoglycan/LPS O-acetylase OafA/YrhL